VCISAEELSIVTPPTPLLLLLGSLVAVGDIRSQTGRDHASGNRKLGATIDNSSAEMHTTIYSISESPKNGQIIWVGMTTAMCRSLAMGRRLGRTWWGTLAA